MSSIDYFLSSIQGNANKRDYVKKYVITFIFVYDILGKRHISFTYLKLHNFAIIDIHFISKQIWQTTLYDT